MEEAGSPETLGDFQLTKPRYNPENLNLKEDS
jgi:hypothetical protein